MRALILFIMVMEVMVFMFTLVYANSVLSLNNLALAIILAVIYDNVLYPEYAVSTGGKR